MRHHSTISEPELLSAEEVDRLVVALAVRCRDLPVLLLYLHGSHAKGAQGPLSDIDLAVLIEPDAARDRERRFEVFLALEEVCCRDDVDFVNMNTAGPIIKDRVVRSGRLVYARSDTVRIRFEAAAVKEALDFRHFSETYGRALFRQLREGRFLGR